MYPNDGVPSVEPWFGSYFGQTFSVCLVRPAYFCFFSERRADCGGDEACLVPDEGLIFSAVLFSFLSER